MDISKLKDAEKPFGPIEKEEWVISVDKDGCIGAGVCTAIASKSFELDEEGKAIILKGVDQENKEAILDAAKACPVAAIIIKDKEGNQIYPK